MKRRPPNVRCNHPPPFPKDPTQSKKRGGSETLVYRKSLDKVKMRQANAKMPLSIVPRDDRVDEQVNCNRFKEK